MNPGDGLTPRQQEVLTLVATGLSNQEISEQLGISHYTTKQHIRALLTEANARDRAQLIVWAVANDVIPRELLVRIAKTWGPGGRRRESQP